MFHLFGVSSAMKTDFTICHSYSCSGELEKSLFLQKRKPLFFHLRNKNKLKKGKLRYNIPQAFLGKNPAKNLSIQDLKPGKYLVPYRKYFCMLSLPSILTCFFSFNNTSSM